MVNFLPFKFPLSNVCLYANCVIDLPPILNSNVVAFIVKFVKGVKGGNSIDEMGKGGMDVPDEGSNQ